MPKTSPSRAREVAVGISATLLLFTSALLIPVAGLFVGIFAPLPTLLFYYRFGRPSGYLIPGGVAAVGLPLLAYLGMAQTIPYLLEMLALGLFLGAAMRQQWSVEKTIGGASLLVFAMGGLIFLWTHSGGEGGVLLNIEEGLHEAISATFHQYGAFSADKQALEETLKNVVPLLVRLLPGAVLTSALVISWLNLLVTWRYCHVYHLPLPSWKEWPMWKAPEPLVWVVIASGFALLLPGQAPKILGLNGLMVLGTVYLFQGLAVITFFFDKWKLPRIVRAILYGLLMLQQFATLGAAFMGLFDVWFDFRRISQKPTSGL